MRPFKPVVVRFGEPLELSARYGERTDDPMLLRQVTDEVMYEIRELTGQEYVDRYASRGSASAPAAAASNGRAADRPAPEGAGADVSRVPAGVGAESG
jgi:1-acyl-sn-glycerol-3-phosphate acyltransferase